MQSHPTTPFGRRPLSLAMVASQAAAKEFAAKPNASEMAVHKWRLFRALTEAKEPVGVTDRALSVLHALLSFHQETALTLPVRDAKADSEDDSPGPGIVVFPSNRELSIRAHGMAPATLRRHLASLVEAGLIIRRDSPNGKRFARRGQGGEIESAFGFDLTPLIARAAEIENLAEEVRAENRAIALLRERITLVRRDIVKMIETGMEEGVRFAPISIDGQDISDWEGLYGRYQALSARYSRSLGRTGLEALAGELAAFAAEIQKLLETHVKQQKRSANESQTERHIQNDAERAGSREGRGFNNRGARFRNRGAAGYVDANLSARHGAASLPRHCRLRQERGDFLLARSDRGGGDRALGARRLARRLETGARRLGRA
ncbi:MAG: replication initiation protein RepC [Methylocystaceae bacterium]|nr:MAG: replication initiation protein RepC [Methylocystaceae bacterium]